MNTWKIIRHNLKQLLIAFDQLLNVLLCSIFLFKEESYADETFSSRSYRWDKDGMTKWPRRIIDALALIFRDKNHCYESYVSERIGRQLPPELRHLDDNN